MQSSLPFLTDSFAFRAIGTPKLVESSRIPGEQVMEVTGVFQNYLLKNANGRVYPKRIWESVLTPGSDFMDRLAKRNVLGMIEHPKDGITIVTEASHVITSVRIATHSDIASSGGKIEEGDVIGTYEVLPGEYFPKAKILEGAIKAKLDFGGVSSRGNGTVTETSDGLEVNDDFVLETWDVVFNPSVKRARPTLRTENAPSSAAPKMNEGASDRGFTTYEAWKRAVKAAGAIKFDGDRDICTALNAENKGVGEWDGAIGYIYNSKGDPATQWGDKGKPAAPASPPVASTFESQPPAPENNDDMQESSFVLVTGLYGLGPATDAKKFIPIQLIAESKKGEASPSFSWKPVNETDKSPVNGIFKQFDEAMSAMTSFCESTGNTFDPTSKTATPAPTTPTMNAQDRIRQIQSEAVMLAKTNRKGLKLSEASSLLEKARSLRLELATIQEGQSALSTFIVPIAKKLQEFEEELDAPPAPEASAPPPPEGGPPAPPEGEGGGSGMTADEAADILGRAVEALNDAGKSDIAGELADVQSQISDSASANDENTVSSVDLDDVPPMNDEAEAKLESSPKARKSFIENYRKLRSRYARLGESSARLLKAYKSLNESSPTGEGSAQLSEAVDRANKSEAAAREIANRYNTEMIEFGQYIWQLKKPKLYEAHKPALDKCRTWKAYDELSRKIMAEAAPESPTGNPPVTESAPPAAPQQPQQPTPPANPPAPPVTESVHPAVASVARARKSLLG